ncbi:hypothetical protein ACQUJV_03835 [Ralstonia pseudosolanacearum]
MMERDRCEELKIVFSLGGVNGVETISIGKSQVNLELREGRIDHVDALRCLAGVMTAKGLALEFQQDGRFFPFDVILKKVQKNGTWGLLSTVNLDFQFGLAGAYGHGFVLVREKAPSVAGCWNAWVEPFLSKQGLIQAWVSDSDYNFWQNVKDPVEYQLAGRDCSFLPMKTNGLPPPLDRKEIDISKNPGRWLLKMGYVEAIGYIMWLSELFWARTGTHRNQLSSVNWLDVSELPKGVTFVKVLEAKFSDERTKDRQDTMRGLLYGQKEKS